MEWEILNDKGDLDAWRVEAIDFENEGECNVAIFAGPGAEERAEEYAAWKNAQKDLAS